jgi:hypothetical protein
MWMNVKSLAKLSWTVGLPVMLLVASPLAVEAAKKVFREDKGPDTVDVSKYPEEAQDTYSGRFLKRCSKCHTVARPINTKKIVLKDEWTTYTKKMMRKPGSGIKEADRRKIVDFLVYDGRVRKPEVYLTKLDEAIKKERDPRRKQALTEERKEIQLRIRIKELDVLSRAEESTAKKAEYEREADSLRVQADKMMEARK